MEDTPPTSGLLLGAPLLSPFFPLSQQPRPNSLPVTTSHPPNSLVLTPSQSRLLRSQQPRCWSHLALRLVSCPLPLRRTCGHSLHPDAPACVSWAARCPSLRSRGCRTSPDAPTCTQKAARCPALRSRGCRPSPDASCSGGAPKPWDMHPVLDRTSICSSA
eukprot:181893-Chlamydomonas_euryale.AAC.1